jgi:hypothetical protein
MNATNVIGRCYPVELFTLRFRSAKSWRSNVLRLSTNDREAVNSEKGTDLSQKKTFIKSFKPLTSRNPGIKVRNKGRPTRTYYDPRHLPSRRAARSRTPAPHRVTMYCCDSISLFVCSSPAEHVTFARAQWSGRAPRKTPDSNAGLLHSQVALLEYTVHLSLRRHKSQALLL